LPTPDGPIHTGHLYDETGVEQLIDTGTREIKSGLAIGEGVRGASDVVFGDTTKFAPSRHIETHSGANNDPIPFDVDYENVPASTLVPSAGWVVPAARTSVDMRLVATDVSGGAILATQTTPPTPGSLVTNNPSATLNGTTATTQTITTSGGVAYWNLGSANGNAIPIQYTVKYDIDTTTVASGLVRVSLYTNHGTSGTTWSQVASIAWDLGQTLTDRELSFYAVMSQNWDVRMVVTPTQGTNPGIVVAKACTYTPVTGGAPAPMAGTFAVLVMEKT
jgi:hypothetical protein